jgi:hypothetical protein
MAERGRVEWAETCTHWRLIWRSNVMHLLMLSTGHRLIPSKPTWHGEDVPQLVANSRDTIDLERNEIIMDPTARTDWRLERRSSSDLPFTLRSPATDESTCREETEKRGEGKTVGHFGDPNSTGQTRMILS